MQKIPTLYERDWDGDRSRVTPEVHEGCEWVVFGEGVPTRKYDGTCCMIENGKLYKRHEVRPGKTPPPTFEAAEFDETTGKTIGWVPVGDGPEDKWHREAFELGVVWGDGTYELLGPKIQGNPEGLPRHTLLLHAIAEVLDDAPRDFGLFAAYFESHPIEGIVWHHPDGRMAKLKARDFGIKREKIAGPV